MENVLYPMLRDVAEGLSRGFRMADVSNVVVSLGEQRGPAHWGRKSNG
jgi:hypothetical protein